MDKIWKQMFYRDQRAARKHNNKIREEAKRSKMTLEEYLRKTGKKLDPEEFGNWTSMMDEIYGKNPEVTDSGVGTTIKDKHKLWQQMDQLAWDLKIGFFHVTGERLVTTKDGKSVVKYSKRMTSKIGEVERMFGLSVSDRGRRTVFRMVRLYASMSMDRNGKMFNQDADEWSMSENDFIRICDLMMESARRDTKHHNPFRIVDPNARLGGTKIYPSGVIPTIITAEICNKNSIIEISADELVEAARVEWTTKTYPRMMHELADNTRRKSKKKGKKKTKKVKVDKNTTVEVAVDDEADEGPNLVAQRIIIEGMQQAIARVDGINISDFSAQYDIDTTDHYTLSEYMDANARYAEAMNDNYDSDVIVARENIKCEEWQKRYARAGYNTFNHADSVIRVNGQAYETNSHWGLRMFVNAIKGNALFAQVGIFIGQVAEHGLANATTGAWVSLSLRGKTSYKMTKKAAEMMRSEEAKEAMSAAKMIFDLYGPGAIRDFCNTGKPMTHENVAQFIRESFLPGAPSENKAKVEQFISEHVNKFMAGDYFFKSWDNVNWYKCFLLYNANQAEVQSARKAKGEVDKMGIALTATEIENTLIAQPDIQKWFTEALKTENGIGAYIAMRGNNIANVNPLSFNVQMLLAEHQCGNAVITAFLDHFPHYGVNFLIALMPFSKTLMYIGAKNTNNSNYITDADMVIGGNLGASGDLANNSIRDLMQDPGYQKGLWMNFTYDLVSMGRFCVVTPVLKMMIMLALGVDFPDDKRNLTNPSAWKVGGVEYDQAFWMNDITLWADPIANSLVVMFKTGDVELATDVFINSCAKMLDGNILLDTINVLHNWQIDLEILNNMAMDPNYDGPEPTESGLHLLLEEYFMKTVNDITPFAPINRTIANSALILGKEERKRDPNREWDMSSEGSIEHKNSKYIQDPGERLLRKYTQYNAPVALMLDLFHGVYLPNSGKTSYFWIGMPPRRSFDPVDLGYADVVSFDYSKRGDMTEAEYAHAKLEDYRAYINEHFSGPMNAVEQGFYLPNENRWAFQDALNSEMNFYDNDLLARELSGELVRDSEEWWEVKNDYSAKKKALKEFGNTWVWNDAIPAGYEAYEQLLTNWDYRFYDTENDKPANWFDYMVSEAFGKHTIEKQWYPKGNAPTTILPWTPVETEGRGYNAETINYWWNKDTTDLEGIRNGIGQTTLTLGRDAGKTVNDIIFGGEQPDYEPYSTAGTFTNPDAPTKGERSWVASPVEMDKGLWDVDNTDASGGIYGDAGKMTPEMQEIIDKLNSGELVPAANVNNVNTFWPSSSYGYGGSYGGYGGGTGGDYNPKIYSTSHQVNSDRAATMYTKSPQTARTTYLRPSYSTKGSREAYKRQDI